MKTDTVIKSRTLLESLKFSSYRVFKANLDIFMSLLSTNSTIALILKSLSDRNRNTLGTNPDLFIEGKASGDQYNLEFAYTLELRAAFSYLVLDGILKTTYRNFHEFWKLINTITSVYIDPSKFLSGVVPKDENIKSFIEVFVEPIVFYLEQISSIDDLILSTMIRYKQRSEWFQKDELIKLSQNNTDKSRNLIEQRLKKHFCLYLYDSGLDFVIEAQSPMQEGYTDIYAKLKDGRRLILEAKVFDGTYRNIKHVRDGINQAMRYANEWSEPYAYLLIYNIAENKQIRFDGISIENDLYTVSISDKRIRIVNLDLDIKLSASKAAQIKQVKIDCTNL